MLPLPQTMIQSQQAFNRHIHSALPDAPIVDDVRRTLPWHTLPWHTLRRNILRRNTLVQGLRRPRARAALAGALHRAADAIAPPPCPQPSTPARSGAC